MFQENNNNNNNLFADNSFSINPFNKFDNPLWDSSFGIEEKNKNKNNQENTNTKINEFSEELELEIFNKNFPKNFTKENSNLSIFYENEKLQNQQTQTIAAFTYAKNLATNIIANVAIASTYQANVTQIRGPASNAYVSNIINT